MPWNLTSRLGAFSASFPGFGFVSGLFRWFRGSGSQKVSGFQGFRGQGKQKVRVSREESFCHIFVWKVWGWAIALVDMDHEIWSRPRMLSDSGFKKFEVLGALGRWDFQA